MLLPIKFKVLYTLCKRKPITLYLNRFRGKPAIPSLIWTFTPNLNSSQYAAHTRVRSSLIKGQPDQG